MALSGPTPEGRVHALWLLQQLSALEVADVEHALKDPDSRIREHAVRLSEPFLNRSKPLADAVLGMIHDPDLHVQFQAAFSFGRTEGQPVADGAGGNCA